MDASFVLDFPKILKGYHEDCLALKVQEDHLGMIKGSWHKLNQGRAYNSMAWHYTHIYDVNKAIMSYELALSIARENNDLILEYDAVHFLGGITLLWATSETQ